MHMRQFGSKQKAASALGFGGAPMGFPTYLNPEGRSEEELTKSSTEAIQYAIENGISYFDTAPAYGSGKSEAILGEALGPYDHSDFIVATKVVKSDYDGTMRSVEESLDRLQLDYIDLIQLHGTSWSEDDANEMLSKGGALAALLALKDEGVVDNIGFTCEDSNRALYILLESGYFDAVQMRYNFCFQHPYDPERPCGSLIEAKDAGLFTVTMRATTGGIFQKFLKAIRPDDDYDYTPDLIRFTLSNPYVDVALVGMRTVGEVKANIELEAGERLDLVALHKKFYD